MMKTCKRCGREFLPHNNSQVCCSRKCNGLLKRKRDIRICEWCGGEFEINKSSPQRFCNEECYGRWKSENIRGNKTSNWQGGDIIKLCRVCGKICYVKKYYINKDICCSVECKNIWQRESGTCNGENNSNWHGGKVLKICEICGSDFIIDPQSNQKFCSYECMGIWRSENFSGENHWNWQGGIGNDRSYITPISQCIKLNKRFDDSHVHHVLSNVVIYIPRKLHEHISHNIKNCRVDLSTYGQ